MTIVGSLHGALVFGRRVRVLAQHLSALMPEGAHVLDVGCGDGQIDAAIMAARPGLRIEGIDVLVRPKTHIPVTKFDGRTIPFGDQSFDIVQFVDVLHHTGDPQHLLSEAARVARKGIVLKDHLQDGLFAYQTLRFMDWVGNAHHGVVLPYNYWPKARWQAAFSALRLKPQGWRERLGLYPAPASWLFDRTLHFVTRLERA